MDQPTGPILLEGIDGAGKTTIAEYYQKEFGYEYVHHGLYESPSDAFVGFSSSIQHRENKNVIVDRLHISELIYGTVLRDECMMAPLYNYLDKILEDEEFVMIWCNPPYVISKNNWSARRETEHVQDTLNYDSIYTYYQVAEFLTRIPVCQYDYTEVEYNAQEPIHQRVAAIRESFYPRRNRL